MKTKSKRACPVCGTLFPDDSESCPVCALQGALGNEQSISESPTEPALSPAQLRFEHYEVLTCDDGTPLLTENRWTRSSDALADWTRQLP